MFTHRTNKGRVVYDRRPKPFRPGDAHRVQTAVIRQADIVDIAGFLSEHLSMALEDIYFMRGQAGYHTAAGTALVDSSVEIMKTALTRLRGFMSTDPDVAKYAALRLIEVVNLMAIMARPR